MACHPFGAKPIYSNDDVFCNQVHDHVWTFKKYIFQHEKVFLLRNMRD